MIEHLFFHAPCFDGVASAALVGSLFVPPSRLGALHLHPVNYDEKGAWLSRSLPENSCVVDFPYHPDAILWADHHPTTFLDAGARLHYSARPSSPNIIYNAEAGSCALLIANRLLETTAAHQRHWRVARAAERIDTATYASVDEALFSNDPAILLANSLADRPPEEYVVFLARLLMTEDMEAAVASAEVVRRVQHVRSRIAAGVDLLRAAGSTRENIFVFDVTPGDVFVHRYAPYAIAAESLYSVGLFRSARGHRIAVMRNPWIDFDSVHLGILCERFGGGGHQRIGAVVYGPADAGKASFAFDSIISALAQSVRPSDRHLKIAL